MASSNGGVPPGFRFHPTDEELLHYYLKKKVCFQKFEMEVIREVDLNKMEPWDLQERCKIGSTPQSEWYLFSHKDRKYPTGSRTNRATNAGFWKATGRDKCIRNSLKKIGMRKTLVFYRGRAPHGQKSDWIMHEYRLEENAADPHQQNPNEDGWVVCRVFKKKNLFKAGNRSNEAGQHHEQLKMDEYEDEQYLQLHHQAGYSGHMAVPVPTFLQASGQLMIPSHEPVLPLALGSAAAYHHYSSSTNSLPPDSALLPMMQVKQLIDHHNVNRPHNEDQISGDPNHWGMINDVDSSKGLGFELAEQQDTTNPSSSNHINQTSEMDFWGYSK